MVEEYRGGNGDEAHGPDFELSHRGVIREDNWEEYAAQGFVPVWTAEREDDVSFIQRVYGTPNVYTGDAWDEDAGKPLRYKPGVGVYTNADGLAYEAARIAARLEERERATGQKPPHTVDDLRLPWEDQTFELRHRRADTEATGHEPDGPASS